MDSDVYLHNRQKRKTLDSPTEDPVDLDVEMAPEYGAEPLKDPVFVDRYAEPKPPAFLDQDVQDTVRVDTTDSDEFYYKLDKSNNKSQSAVSQQFLSNFLLEFTDDELAAKRTVETIYSATGSFAYTYRSLDEAFFSRSTNLSTLMPFVKAIVSVADESLLLKSLETPKKAEPVPDTSPVDKSLLLNFELIMLGQFRPMRGKLAEFMSASFPLSWRELNEFITLLFKDGILAEFYTFFSNVYGIYEIYLEDFKRYMMDLRLYLTRLNEFLTLDEKKAKRPKSSTIYSLKDCVDIVNFLSLQMDNIRKVFLLIVRDIANTPVTDSLEKALASLESDLSSQGLLRPDESDLSDKVSCVRMLLDEDSLRFIGSQSSLKDSSFCRGKFNTFYKAYQEELQRRSDESSEFLKKKKFKRDSIQYVLDRLEELASATLPVNCKNPFYTVGIAPRLCAHDSLRKYSKKLKTLLHPDTEHDAEWKQKAEKAFKEASLALDQCLNLVDSFSATLYRVGPVPPYLAHLGINLTDDSGYLKTATTAPGPAPEPAKSGEQAPLEQTFLFFPEFSIRCEDLKVGSLSVELDLTALFETKLWHSLGRNKFVTLFMHRPLHVEPMTVQVKPEMLSSVQKQPLADAIKNKTPIFKVDAVQPIQFGSSWKYFVGVKLSGERGSTLVTWKSVFIELAAKGRTVGHIVRLLGTFHNASFVNQALLQEKLRVLRGSSSKSEGERFLAECVKKAQKWADEN